MNYIELKIIFSNSDPWKDIVTNMLGDIGFDSFAEDETDNSLLAYVPENNFDISTIEDILDKIKDNTKTKTTYKTIEAKNWNAEWEASYQPVLINDKCYIRAPFHAIKDDVDFNIIIEPKMSFGTAHNETTFLMIEYLLEENVANKSFLDMGSGTGVLSILASLKNANPVVAVDNDDWAFNNNIENNMHNNIKNITTILGDASNIPKNKYDYIFANINRNTLLNDISKYADNMKEGSALFLSGFYQNTDLEIIKNKCNEFNLSLISFKEKNDWVAAKFLKKVKNT